MGKYSVRGSPQFDAIVDAHLERIAGAVRASRWGASCRAIVLIGGYGRGEGTPLIDGEQERPFNDYDLVVVTGRLSRRRAGRAQADLRRLEQSLTAEVGLPVDLCLYTLDRLRRAEFSLLNYEMRYGHRLLWGDPAIARQMPDYPHAAIPRSEGTRLLMNRGKLLLDVMRLLRTGAPLDAAGRERCLKFFMKADLACGDSALLLTGAYDISYARKRETIGSLAGAGIPEFDRVSQRYRRAIAFKEWGDFCALAGIDVAAEWSLTRDMFIGCFRWHERRRVGADPLEGAAYARALRRLAPEAGRLKSALLHVIALRGRALRCGAGLWAHPRLRLYAALPWLLAEDAEEARPAAAALGCPAGSRDGVEQAFYALQRRFS